MPIFLQERKIHTLPDEISVESWCSQRVCFNCHPLFSVKKWNGLEDNPNRTSNCTCTANFQPNVRHLLLVLNEKSHWAIASAFFPAMFDHLLPRLQSIVLPLPFSVDLINGNRFSAHPCHDSGCGL
jgi:hypothetical protein